MRGTAWFCPSWSRPAKGFEFVTALLDGGLVEVGLLRSRAGLLPIVPLRIRRVVDWLDAYTENRAGR